MEAIIMSNKNKGRDFLFSDDCGFINDEDGESYRYSDGSGYYKGKDGSEGYIYSDGSGYYHGADGSDGYIYSDGSAYYRGADGSDGYKYSDGSGYYRGADGSDGYKYSDGSGYFNSASGDRHSIYADTEKEPTDSTSDSLSSTFGSLLATTIMLGFASHKKKKRIEAEYEEACRIEEERIRAEKAKARKERNTLRFKRVKAFLFNGRKIAISYDYTYLLKKDVSFVVSALTQNAFSDIKTIPINDIYTDTNYSVGEVEQVIINGSGFFQAGDEIPYDTEIIITYHVKRRITIPFSERDLRKLHYIDAGGRLEDLGFTEIYTRPIKDLATGWLKKDGSIEKITIGGMESFRKNSVFVYDAKILIEYHTFKNK